MPRQKNTRPTAIYWLIDTRTGIPFYCGKTVKKPLHRLIAHKTDVLSYPRRPLSLRFAECQGHVDIRVIEVVPITKPWADRERYWIRLGRKRFPLVNVTDGGQGAPGNVHSSETRAKLSKAAKKRGMPDFVRAASIAAVTGKPQSAEHRAKISATNTIRAKGRIIPRHVREAQRKAATGRKHTDQHRAKISAANIGHQVTAETRARIAAANTGKPVSESTREKIRTIRLGSKSAPGVGAKIAASNLGKKRTPEQRARMSAAAFAREARRAKEAAQNA